MWSYPLIQFNSCAYKYLHVFTHLVDFIDSVLSSESNSKTDTWSILSDFKLDWVNWTLILDLRLDLMVHTHLSLSSYFLFSLYLINPDWASKTPPHVSTITFIHSHLLKSYFSRRFLACMHMHTFPFLLDWVHWFSSSGLTVN